MEKKNVTDTYIGESFLLEITNAATFSIVFSLKSNRIVEVKLNWIIEMKEMFLKCDKQLKFFFF